MKDLWERLRKLDKNNNLEERVMFQVMDFELIKFNGLQSGDILLGDAVCQSIDRCIHGYIAMYKNGSSMSQFVPSDEFGHDDYEEMKKAFSIFNDFMRTHMHLNE